MSKARVVVRIHCLDERAARPSQVATLDSLSASQLRGFELASPSGHIEVFQGSQTC